MQAYLRTPCAIGARRLLKRDVRAQGNLWQMSLSQSETGVSLRGQFLTSDLSAGPKLRAEVIGGGPVKAPLRKKADSCRVCEGIFEWFCSAKPKRVDPGGVGAAAPRHYIHLNKFLLHTASFPLTSPAAADACISAMLSLAIAKSRGPLPAGGTDCSTLRSTIGLNGASFWAKRG